MLCPLHPPQPGSLLTPGLCLRLLLDAKGTIREIVLPKGLDLDRPKRTRTSFTAEQLYRLELEFQRCQYVVGRERTELARQLNLSETQVRGSCPRRTGKPRHPWLDRGHVSSMQPTAWVFPPPAGLQAGLGVLAQPGEISKAQVGNVGWDWREDLGWEDHVLNPPYGISLGEWIINHPISSSGSSLPMGLSLSAVTCPPRSQAGGADTHRIVKSGWGWREGITIIVLRSGRGGKEALDTTPLH